MCLQLSAVDTSCHCRDQNCCHVKFARESCNGCSDDKVGPIVRTGVHHKRISGHAPILWIVLVPLVEREI